MNNEYCFGSTKSSTLESTEVTSFSTFREFSCKSTRPYTLYLYARLDQRRFDVMTSTLVSTLGSTNISVLVEVLQKVGLLNVACVDWGPSGLAVFQQPSKV